GRARRVALARVLRAAALPDRAGLRRQPRAVRRRRGRGRDRRRAPRLLLPGRAVVPVAVPRGAVLLPDAHRLLARVVARDRGEVLSPLAAAGLRPAAPKGAWTAGPCPRAGFRAPDSDRLRLGRPRAGSVLRDPRRLRGRLPDAQPLELRAPEPARVDAVLPRSRRAARSPARPDARLQSDRPRLPGRRGLVLPAVLARGRAGRLRARAAGGRQR